MITKEEALLKVEPKQLDQLLHPNFDAASLKAAKVVAKGLAASPGAGCGKIYFTAEDVMEAAKNGVIEGMATSSSAVYPDDAYREYSDRKENLLMPYSVDIINISYEDFGFDNEYDKKQIQFQVYAKTSDRFDSDELVSIGDRINYNLRKSIAISFNTTDATNNLYNPVFSPHYVYTTANVKWV